MWELLTKQNRAWDDGMKWGNRLTASHTDKYLEKNKAPTRPPLNKLSGVCYVREQTFDLCCF